MDCQAQIGWTPSTAALFNAQRMPAVGEASERVAESRTQFDLYDRALKGSLRDRETVLGEQSLRHIRQDADGRAADTVRPYRVCGIAAVIGGAFLLGKLGVFASVAPFVIVGGVVATAAAVYVAASMTVRRLAARGTVESIEGSVRQRRSYYEDEFSKHQKAYDTVLQEATYDVIRQEILAEASASGLPLGDGRVEVADSVVKLGNIAIPRRGKRA